MSSNNVVVLGAGITGLQTALTLLKAGYNVSTVAQYLPGDEASHYTSPWAGANWRTHASKTDTEQRDWDTQTYTFWKSLVREEASNGRAGSSGISMVPGTQYWDAATEEVEHGIGSAWWTAMVDDVEEIPREKLPEGALYGLSYTTFTVDVPRYLKYLVGEVEALGGRFHRCTLPADRGLEMALETAGREAGFAVPFAAVNATGIAAKTLVGDEALDVIQGQTVRVRGEAKGQVCRIGKDILDVCVVMPFPGTGESVVGSSRDPGNWDVRIREDVTRALLGKGRVLAPELLNAGGEFDVIKATAGLRPYRKGGARVEIEEFANGDIVCCHAYGHGGAGYQNSVGSANKVLRLLKEYKSNLKTSV